MKRVKRFFDVAKAVLQLINNLLPLVGDVMECIKVVDTIVAKFNEEREKGTLKDVSFVEFTSGVIRLISEVVPFGLSFFDAVERIVFAISNLKEIELNAQNS